MWRKLLVAVACSAAVGGTRIVVWTDEKRRFPREMWNEEVERLAGLVRCENGIADPTNYCRAASCEFVRLPIPLAANKREVEAEGVAMSASADVVVVPAQMIRFLVEIGKRSVARQLLPSGQAIRVLYWREAYQGAGIPEDLQRELFDLNMGVHFYSSILNPTFIAVEASQFAARPFERRATAAFYVASHCDVQPRTDYVAALRESGLVVDEYGECSGRPLESQPELASRFKFYLSFENTIAHGYVTEKLLRSPMHAGAVPVYLGAPDASRLSTRRWFVDAADFDEPRDLAAFLRRLDAPAWQAYRDARAALFRDAPLNLAAAANRSEVDDLVHKDKVRACPRVRYKAAAIPLYATRVAALCRLCDLAYLDRLRRTLPFTPVKPPLAHHRLACLFLPDCPCRTDDFPPCCPNASRRSRGAGLDWAAARARTSCAPLPAWASSP